MWTGLGPTILRDTPFSAVYWMAFEYFKKKLGQGADLSTVNTFTVAFVSGALSGALAATATTPIDVIKTRIQADTVHLSMTQTSKLIYQQDGWVGFFRGYVPRIARVAPACAIMISSYELIKRLI
jgi:solute carrier family 25 protein 39/40